MTNRDRLLQEIEKFRTERSLSERAFSIAATGNPKFVSRLRSGVSTLRSIETAEAYMRAQHKETA